MEELLQKIGNFSNFSNNIWVTYILDPIYFGIILVYILWLKSWFQDKINGPAKTSNLAFCYDHVLFNRNTWKNCFTKWFGNFSNFSSTVLIHLHFRLILLDCNHIWHFKWNRSLCQDRKLNLRLQTTFYTKIHGRITSQIG